MEVEKKIKSFTLLPPKICRCKHELVGTGVFFQSVGLIYCLNCSGWQEIRKPMKC